MLRKIDPREVFLSENPTVDLYVRKMIHAIQDGNSDALGYPIVVELPEQYQRYGKYAVYDGNRRVLAARTANKPINMLVLKQGDRLKELESQPELKPKYQDYRDLDEENYNFLLDIVLKRIDDKTRKEGRLENLARAAVITIFCTSIITLFSFKFTGLAISEQNTNLQLLPLISATIVFVLSLFIIKLLYSPANDMTSSIGNT
jgi:hypothetical protein